MRAEAKSSLILFRSMVLMRPFISAKMSRKSIEVSIWVILWLQKYSFFQENFEKKKKNTNFAPAKKQLLIYLLTE